MTKQEALAYLEQYQATSVDKDSNLDKALNEAIKALNILSSYKPYNCRFAINHRSDCFECFYLNMPVTDDNCSKCRFYGEKLNS